MPIDNRGSKNPFYGRIHSAETKAKISATRKGKALGNQNAKGYKHTPEAIEKIRKRSLELWQTERGKMIFANGAFPETIRNGFSTRTRGTEFTITHRKKWLKDRCEWCESRSTLELDHIIARFLGGEAIKENAQTLCKSCNYWKHNHIDLPNWRSLQAAKGTSI